MIMSSRYLILACVAIASPWAAAMQRPADGLDQVPMLADPILVGPPVRIDTGRGTSACNETSVASSEATPMQLLSAWNDYRAGAPRIGVGLSRDGGLTWTDGLLRPPLAHQSSIEADPMTASDDRTGTLWAGGISFGSNGGVFVARKDPGSQVFEPVVMAYTGAGADKCLMAAGPDPLAPETHTRVYVSFNQGLIASGDMGATWSAPLALDMGIGFVPQVGPSGTLYIAYWDTQDRIELIRSLDGGSTVEPPVLIAQRLDVWGLDGTRTPGNFRVGSFPALAVDPVSEALYCVYADSTVLAGAEFDVDLYFTRSLDRGLTWSQPEVILAGAIPFGDQFFPWLDVDLSGRVHIVYYDTGATRQSDDALQGLLDARYGLSVDGGDAWLGARLTNEPFSSELDGFGGIFIGDYLGLACAGGRTTPVYMSTELGNADLFARSVNLGAATAYCLGYTCPCGNVDSTSGCGNSGVDGNFETGARLQATGSNDLAHDDLQLDLTGLRPLAFGLLLASRIAISPPFGDGRRCVGGQVFRYPIRRADGAGVLGYGPTEVIALSQALPGNGAAQIASTWHYQGWYRDSGGPCDAGFNLTNGLRVTWR